MLQVALSFTNRFVDQLQILQCHFSSFTEKLSPELVTAHACKCKKLYGDNSAQEDLLGYGLSQLFREDGVHKESSETQKQRLGAFLRRIGGGTRFGGKKPAEENIPLTVRTEKKEGNKRMKPV